ncbi:MAG: pyridoxal phosphate-dependent aminotransferase [Candidatus Bathyarchaeia archaeon]|jgi:aspartate/methionine/tyrosine aminotransferase
MERDFVSDRSKSVVRSGIRVMYDLALGVGGLVHLEIGEPDFSTPQHIVAAAKKALDEGYTRYTPNAGYRDLRESVSRKVSKDNGIEADPESEIIITSGAMQAISSATLVTINPGDEVIIPDPAYESFVRQTRFASGIPVPVQVKEEDEFRLKPEKVERAITKRTKMIIINSPANPTGSVMSKNDLEGIAELAIRHNLLVLSDEIYEKMLYDGARHYSIASFPGMKERTITVFAFSKTYAMTGWRVGYAVAPKSIVGEMTKIQEFYVTCATSICQRAALAALEGPQDFVTGMVAEFKRRRDFMYDEIGRMRGFSCVKPKGAFYLFPNVSRTELRKDDPAKDLLEKCKVVTAPGKAFGGYADGYVRISLASSMGNLRTASERMLATFAP